MKDNLAIIGASYFQLPLIERAKDLGYVTHVFAWAANDVGETVADYFYPISIIEKDKILDVCKSINICGICSIASDLAMLTVNYVAKEMQLVGNTMSSTYKSTNKYLMRQAFKENGDPSVECVLVDINTDLKNAVKELTFPVIVKPTDRSGSRGVCKVDDIKSLDSAVNVAIEESFEKKAIIENYINGDEYSVEGISYNGKHKILAVTKKYTTGAPHFIEIRHVEPAPINSVLRNEIEKVVMHALNSLEIRSGASHAEIKVENGDIKIVEIGGRMGGDCIGSHLVQYSTGIDYIKAVIDIAVGNIPDLTSKGEKLSAETRFVLTEEDLAEFERMKENEPERILYIADDRHLYLVGKTTNSSNRAGCYIVRK